MKTLGIETSCDETGVAIVDSEKGLLTNVLYSQIAVHAPHGGVVPELASRDHIKKLLPLVGQALRQAKLSFDQLNGIAYTAGPGLMGALLVGATVARSLAYALNIPAIGIHHMEAHLLAPMLEAEKPPFPFLALLASGGHTLLVQVEAIGQYKILGESVDDAAGEAFDKVAKLLGLPYPGGPHLAKLAEQGKAQYQFPRPMLDQPNLNFSFSGLKTSAIMAWQKSPKDEAACANIAFALQEAVADTLVEKTRRALYGDCPRMGTVPQFSRQGDAKQGCPRMGTVPQFSRQGDVKQDCPRMGLSPNFPAKETFVGLSRRGPLVVAGGVSANLCLREKLKSLPAKIFLPRLEFCTDNAAMIAYTGCQRFLRGEKDGLEINVYARKSLEEL